MNPQAPHTHASEERQSLWLLTISPGIWAAHFLASYTAAALWCGKITTRAGTTGGLQLAIAGFGLMALIAILVTGWVGWRKHRHGTEEPPHDKDTPEDRQRFLGFATVLLSGLSAIGTIYVILSAFFVSGCF